jgi:uncharacterized protein
VPMRVGVPPEIVEVTLGRTGQAVSESLFEGSGHRFA